MIACEGSADEMSARQGDDDFDGDDCDGHGRFGLTN